MHPRADGFDGSRDGPTSCVVCARKFDSGAPAVQLQDTGIVATVPEPGEDAAAFAAFGMLAALRARRPRRA